jgi:hypothetical protein
MVRVCVKKNSRGMYEDTLNALWRGEELVTYSEAKALAETYLETAIASLDA